MNCLFRVTKRDVVKKTSFVFDTWLRELIFRYILFTLYTAIVFFQQIVFFFGGGGGCGWVSEIKNGLIAAA